MRIEAKVVTEVDDSFGFLYGKYVVAVEKFSDFRYFNLSTFEFVPGVVDVPAKKLK